jgi:DNA-binding transcriptional regulator YhcF (GntR family)
MRGKDFNAGLRGVLFEARHYERMGAAVWLYGWLVLRQTHQTGSLGWVLGGSPVSYREIEEETGFNCRTLERWMRTLRHHGYIETDAVPGGVVVRITKAKKFPQGGRGAAGGLRRLAGAAAQSCVAGAMQIALNQSPAARISSSSVAGSQERQETQLIHRDFHRSSSEGRGQSRTSTPNPSGLGQRQNEPQSPQAEPTQAQQLSQPQAFFLEARLRQQLLRAERDEAVRRELAVGTGPEVQRG